MIYAKHKLLGRVLALALVVVMVAAMLPVNALGAAATGGFITVTVKDPSNAPISGAAVTATAEGVTVSGVTDGEGKASLSTGEFMSKFQDKADDTQVSVNVSVSAAGFMDGSQNVSLTVGNPSTAVEIGLKEAVTITVAKTGKGTVTLNGEDKTEVTVEKGSTVTVAYTPVNEISSVKSLTVGTAAVDLAANATSYTFTAEKNTIIGVEFETMYPITTSVEGSGTVTAEKSMAQSGDKVVFKAKAEGTGFVQTISINGDTKSIQPGNGCTNLTFEIAVTGKTDVKVTFAERGSWFVVEFDPTRGSVQVGDEVMYGTGRKYELYKGIRNVKLKAVPKDGYRFSGLWINNTLTTVSNVNAMTLTEKIDSGASEVKVTFAPNQYKISAQEATNGSITSALSADGKDTVEYGGSVVLKFAPAEDYEIQSVTLGGETFNATADQKRKNEMTVKVPALFGDELTGDTLKISATFALVSHTVTLVADSGTFTGVDGTELETTQSVELGGTFKFKYKPADGFQLERIDYVNTKNGATEELTADGDGVYSVAVNGDSTITATVKDVQAPTVTAAVENADGWAREKTITAQAEDNAGGDTVKIYISDKKYDSLEAITTAGLEAAAQYTAQANATYYVYAVDEAGNLGSTSVNVTKIDRAAPVMESLTKSPETPAQKVTVTFSAVDETSGIKGWSYKAGADGSLVNLDNSSFTVTENGAYYLYVEDNAGNILEQEIVITNIDQTAPVISSLAQAEVWSKDSVAVSFQVTEENTDNLEGVYWSATQLTTLDAIKAANNAAAGADGYSFDATANADYYVYAVDKAGNFSEATICVTYMDTTAPVVDAVNGVPSGWVNEAVELTIQASDVGSGVEKVIYATQSDVTKATDEAELMDGEATVTIPAESFNGKYYFWAVDNVGNVSQVKEVTIQIDVEAPENLSMGYVQTEGKGFVANESGRLIFDDQVFITIQATDARTNADGDTIDSGIAQYQYQLVADGQSLTENWQVVESTGDSVEIKLPLAEGESFIGTVYVRVVDQVGNASAAFSDAASATVIVKDNTPPEQLDIQVGGASIVGDAGTAIYYSSAVKIELSAEDLTSGLKPLQYQKVASAGDYSETGVWLTYDPATGIEGKPNEQFIIYFKAEDQAGKSAIVSSKTIVMDDKAPTAQFQLDGSRNAAQDIFNGDVTVTVTVDDPKYLGDAEDANGVCSGVAEVAYTISGQGMTTIEGTVADPGSWDGKIVIDEKQITCDDVTVEVTVTDAAGNSQTYTCGETIKIDTKAPEVKVAYNAATPDAVTAAGNLYRDQRTVTVTVVEHNFDEKLVEITQTGKNGGVAPAVEWKHEGDTHTLTLTYSADGDYTFQVAGCADLADNKAADVPTEEQTFTIDGTAPTISVTYDNNDAANEKYFKEIRTATVTIVERNFVADEVTVNIGADRGGVAPAVNWVTNGDTHTATLKYETDGDYTFEISAADAVGNEAGPAAYGNSVAAQDFVIDTTFEDMVTIRGVTNGMAYGYDDAVIPEIEITDINLADYALTLVGVQKDKTIDLTAQANALIQAGEETVTGVFDLFQVSQAMDGIYTLTVTGEDKAGNEDSETVVFTVNRFGSVYVYSDYLLELIADGGRYVTGVTEDLVITEYNADQLLEGSVKVEITVDGRPLENVIYTVTPEVNDKADVGESGWYQYKYTISKDNFTTDGVYKISISSKDGSGNSPETDTGITFRVDSTSPEITSIVGLEETIINAQSVTVKYTVFDTIGLKAIKVYVDGQLVDEITDFTADANNYSGQFVLNEKTAAQTVRIVAEDMAGNITDTDAEGFVSAFQFNDTVTVSTNLFVRWYANKPLFWGSIIGLAVLAGGIIVFLVARRKKEEE